MGGARPWSSDRLTTHAKGSGKRERQKPRSTQTLRANQAQREQSDGGVLSGSVYPDPFGAGVAATALTGRLTCASSRLPRGRGNRTEYQRSAPLPCGQR